LFFIASQAQAQEKSKYALKLYPFPFFNNARLGFEYTPLKKRLGYTATASYYYDKYNKGGGRPAGFMGQLFLTYHLIDEEKKYPIRVYAGAGYYNFKTGYTYSYERWDYDKTNGRELSYVPFATNFGGTWSSVQISKATGIYGEMRLMGSVPLVGIKHLSFGWHVGYRINPVPSSLKNLYSENYDQFDYKWYKIHFAYSPSLNKYYYSLGTGTGIKANISVNYLF